MSDEEIRDWNHLDGSECDAGFLATRPRPDEGSGTFWWCTEHQKRLAPRKETASSDLIRWGDRQQYYSESMPEEAKKGPVVTLLNATPDPLGNLAAIVAIYKGKVVRDLSKVTDDERRDALAQMQKTALQGPLESVTFSFLIEGVSRDWTHQAVRDRRSFFAQESLRFAVKKEDWPKEVPLPPSLASLHPDHWQVMEWKNGLENIADAYQALVEGGVPAEEARKILPHATTTRLHYVMNLRTLLHVAGLRTCTQAQFDWRLVLAGMAKALREYQSPETVQQYESADGYDGWQFKLIADQLRPICYQTGRCEFMAEFDRACSIRDRVEVRSKHGGTDSSQWHKPFLYNELHEAGELTVKSSEGIHDWEWAADPEAARKRVE